jgi:hypothetical protein
MMRELIKSHKTNTLLEIEWIKLGSAHLQKYLILKASMMKIELLDCRFCSKGAIVLVLDP